MRLEFLSELPERLAEMIDNKMYKEAVQLYNKTISVLTRHQHVLSFKNIKVCFVILKCLQFLCISHLGENRADDEGSDRKGHTDA